MTIIFITFKIDTINIINVWSFKFSTTTTKSFLSIISIYLVMSKASIAIYLFYLRSLSTNCISIILKVRKGFLILLY